MTTGGAPVPIIYGGTGSTTASAARTALGLAIGSDVQAYNANLAAEAGLVTAASKITQWTGSGTAQLKDFLENTAWTPVIEGTSTAGAGTYSVQVGRYTKIGDIVFCTANLTWSAHTGTGNMQINGLPYTVRNTTSVQWMAAGNFMSNLTLPGTSTYYAAYAVANTTTCALSAFTTAAAAASIVLDTAAGITVSFFYSTAS